MAKEKREKTTLQYYKSWKATKYALYGTKWVAPVVPAVVITGINWEEWFTNQGASLPSGLAMLLVSILTTILAMSKKDEIVEKKVSYMFYLAGILAIWGVAFMLLASIMDQMGMMLIYTCLGIIGGGVADQVNKGLVNDRLLEYKQLIDENCLDKKAIAKQERKEKAKRERQEKAKLEAEKQQATE